jgi:hypothetical protein
MKQKKTPVLHNSSLSPRSFSFLPPIPIPNTKTTKKSQKPIETVCSKLADSFIFDSEGLDSMVQPSAPLTYECFEKLRFLGQGKFGQVHLVKY